MSNACFREIGIYESRVQSVKLDDPGWGKGDHNILILWIRILKKGRKIQADFCDIDSDEHFY